MKNYNWVLFLDERFSEDFKENLSNSLSEEFDKIVNVKNAIDLFNFQLIVGIVELNMIENDEGYSFMDVELILPSSESIATTICWETNINLTGKELNNESEKYLFHWTTNFPKERVFSFLKTKKINLNNIELEILDYSLPDVMLTFYFKNNVSENEINLLHKLIKNYFKELNETIYLSDFNVIDKKYSIHIDTQNIIVNFNTFFDYLNNQNEINFIKKIRIE